MADDWSSHERRLLDALQADDQPSAPERARVKQRVFAELGFAAGAGAVLSASAKASAAPAATSAPAALSGAASQGAAGSAGAASGAATGGKASLVTQLGASLSQVGLVKALSVVGVAAVLGGGVWALSPPAVEKAPPVVHAPAVQIPSTAAVAPPEANTATVEAAKPVPPAVVTPRHAPSRKTSPKAVSRRGAESSIQAEAELLSAAHRAIQSGQPKAAMKPLLEHQRRFPAGTLALERQATLAIARCQGGERGRGRADAERYRHAHPKSPMVKRLEDACGLAPKAD